MVSQLFTYKPKLKLICAMVFTSLLFIHNIAQAAREGQAVNQLLFHSQMAQRVGQSQDPQVKKYYQQAKDYYAQSQVNGANSEEQQRDLIEQAMLDMLQANKLVSEPQFAPSVEVSQIPSYQKIQFQQKEKAIRSLLTAEQTIIAEKNITGDNLIALQVSKLVRDANDNLDNEQYQEAALVLDQGYRLIMASVISLRSGETLFHELNFIEPQDEYDYYLEKITSMMAAVEVFQQRDFHQVKKERLTRMQSKISSLLIQAKPLAIKGEYKDAIVIMDKAFQYMENTVLSAVY